jgi:4-hydroxy-tetrahydrodipicolinate reductase
MGTITILGDGALGRAIAAAAEGRGEGARLVGRPAGIRHPATTFNNADIVVDASRGDAVLANLDAATDAGRRRFVIAATGWQGDADEVAATLRRTGSIAVAAPNLALGAAIFLRLVERAGTLLAAVGGFEPSIVEWHRRSKVDRPSGTAREIVRRLSTSLPIEVDDVAVVRAGWMPGLHAVAFDGPSETIELRLTARDRSGYAAGALHAIDWLRTTPATPGIHAFDEVVDGLLRTADEPGVPAMTA